MQTFEPTDEQHRVIDHRGSHMLVFAGPGTGKTETLARRFASLVHDDRVPAGSILVLTFSRRAADAMRQRIVTRMRERAGKGIAVPELHVHTFHRFCSRLLDGDAARGARRDLLTPVKERLLWNRVIAGLSLRTFAADVVSSSSFATAVLNFIARLKGEGVGVDAFAAEAAGDERLADLARLYRAMDEQRTRLGLSDFRDLVADAVRELHSPESAASAWLRRRGTFAHVLVDEFQDSDHMQLQLLEALGGDALFARPPTPQMCFVGDFNQSIYRFRGADPSNIAQVKSKFSCTEFGLRLNRRSVQAVLDVANRTPRLREESLTQAEPGRQEGGSVRLLRTDTADDEIAAVADAIAQRVRGGAAPGSIAVLLRVVEPYRGAIARELETRGIPVAAQSTTGFHEDALVDAVLSCVRIIAGSRDRDVWKRLLINPLIGFRPLAVSIALFRDPVAVDNPRKALAAQPPEGRIAWDEFLRRLDRCRDAGGQPYRFDPAALVRAIARELDLLWPIRDASADAGAVDRTPLAADGAVDLHGRPPRPRSEVPGFHPTASPARLDALIQAAGDIGATWPKLGGKRLDATSFLETLDEVIALIGDPYEGPEAGIEGVPVMSIHGAKGLEFDFVVVPQLLDGVLPTHARPDPLLGNRRSRYSQRIDDAALEEASLWYVAVTRARFDVLATAARVGDEADEQPLSPYAYLIPDVTDVSNDEWTGRAARVAAADRVGPTGFAAAYAAATAGDRDVPAVARYLALRPVLDAFVREGALRDEPARPLTWDLDRLSPSGIERYVECPRRWFYQYALLLPDDDDDLTRMGRFVHKVLERYHNEERDFTAAAASHTVESVMAALLPLAHDEALRAAAKGGLSTDSSMFRYEYARIVRQLTEYAAWLVDEARLRPFTVLACEQRIDIPLGDVRLVGYVDRVDRLAGGGLVVRDYKSGRLRGKTSVKAFAAALEQLDENAPGLGLFGDMPDGLRLQTFLYVRGVEALFEGRVARADYLYLAGTAGSKASTETCVDSFEIGDDVRGHLDVVYDVIAASIARDITGGLTAFPTALDDSACRFCKFIAICPGPGTVAYATHGKAAMAPADR